MAQRSFSEIRVTGDTVHGMSAARTDPERPGIRPAAVVVLGVEALMLTVTAGYLLTRIGSADLGASFAASLAVFILIFAVALALAVRSLLRGGRFGIGFGVTWQLFQALVGASLLRGGSILPGVAALVLAIVAFVLLTSLARSAPLPYQKDPED